MLFANLVIYIPLKKVPKPGHVTSRRINIRQVIELLHRRIHPQLVTCDLFEWMRHRCCTLLT